MDIIAFTDRAAWCSMLVGGLWGAVLGMSFHRDDWLGGYGSLRRRMLRLGHIACFGLAFVALEAVREAATHPISSPVLGLGCASLCVSLATMPIVCALTAWKPVARYGFSLPVGAFLFGVLMVASMARGN